MRQGLALIVNGLAALTSSPIAGALLEAADGDFKYAIAFGVRILPPRRDGS